MKGFAKSAGERLQKSTADLFGAIDKLESAYFDFHAHMRRITGRDARSGLRLNLLFLIDDLDRCMPEKAVEMLESIKLFLDVPGCAFVVAIDDEVVERGILHRYRDYLGRSARGRTLAALPITGHEYLEKIIRLPFRLPPYSESQVRAYLLHKFPSLYAPIKTIDPGVEAASGAAAPRAVKSAEPRAGSAEIENPLLQFAAAIVPRVPRKQIRFSELLELLCSLPGAAVRDGDAKHRLLFGTVVALHLFAPELFRFVARKLPTFMARYRQWDESGAWYAQEGLLASLQSKLKEKTAVQPPNRGDIEDAEYQVRLLELTETARQNRGGFDPRGLVAALKDVDIQELGSYLRLLTDIAVTASVPPAAAPEKLLEPIAVPREKRLEAADPRREVELHEIEEALNGLLSNAPEARDNAFERIRDRLSGAVLSARAAKALRERALREGFLAARNTEGTLVPWLAQLAPHWSVDEWGEWLTLQLDGAKQRLIDPADAVNLVEANFSTLEAASGIARVLVDSGVLDRLATAVATPGGK